MFFSIFLFFSLLSQDTLTDSLHYYPTLKKIPELEVSPFRGEPYIFEVTQPYLNLDERTLSFIDISNQRNIPYPPDFNYFSFLQNIPFENTDFVGYVICPAYILQNLYITLFPSPTSLFNSNGSPAYLRLRGFNKKVPFSQIRLFRDKAKNENMQFTFGRNITKYGRFNAAADYLDESEGTKRSIGLDTEVDLPFNTSSHFIFFDIKDEKPGYPIEQKLLSFSVSRKEGIISLFQKRDDGKEYIGGASDLYLGLPYQKITVGFDFPSFDSSYYQAIFVDRINPTPLLYIVPKLVVDAEKEHSLSLGAGYHPQVKLFVYGNVLYDKEGTIYSSIGIRTKRKKSRFESFIFWRDVLTKEGSGAALFYNGEVSPNFYLTSLLVSRLDGENFIYLQPLYQKPFKKGKLKPGIFSGIGYNRDGMTVNTGIVIEIIDVSLYFVFDDVIDSEKREYKFGVQWNFYD
ncbi:MAG: hypothetical protein E3J87_02880 [Candidatus Cloacimonadota bacterium]|nr:MAG: hypothetical protein E3J87_02880 [Candidatus Cloacimonadota bacterium]